MKPKHEFCGMAILLLTATSFELSEDLVTRHSGVETLVGGVGVPATIYSLQKKLSGKRYDLVIQAGIGGSFASAFQDVETVLVERDCFADLGTEEKGVFKTIFESGLGDAGAPPFSDGWLLNRNPLLAAYPLPKVAAITVNKVSDSPLQQQQQIHKYNPAIESMEGAALHYVCLQEKVPFLQLRTVSNLVGERDKSKWKLAEAIEVLNQELEKLLQFVKSNLRTS